MACRGKRRNQKQRTREPSDQRPAQKLKERGTLDYCIIRRSSRDFAISVVQYWSFASTAYLSAIRLEPSNNVPIIIPRLFHPSQSLTKGATVRSLSPWDLSSSFSPLSPSPHWHHYLVAHNTLCITTHPVPPNHRPTPSLCIPIWSSKYIPPAKEGRRPCAGWPSVDRIRQVHPVWICEFSSRKS